jgi:CrcB protein
MWLGVAGAGAVGAPLRWVVDDAVSRRQPGRFPTGILVVNTTGSFVLGFLAGLVLYHGAPANLRVVAGTGLCGAYTTFATFSFDTVALFQEDHRVDAVANVAVTIVAGLLAAAAGLALASIG